MRLFESCHTHHRGFRDEKKSFRAWFGAGFGYFSDCPHFVGVETDFCTDLRKSRKLRLHQRFWNFP
jgi:hypothetical protein